MAAREAAANRSLKNGPAPATSISRKDRSVLIAGAPCEDIANWDAWLRNAGIRTHVCRTTHELQRAALPGATVLLATKPAEADAWFFALEEIKKRLPTIRV